MRCITNWHSLHATHLKPTFSLKLKQNFLYSCPRANLWRCVKVRSYVSTVPIMEFLKPAAFRFTPTKIIKNRRFVSYWLFMIHSFRFPRKELSLTISRSKLPRRLTWLQTDVTASAGNKFSLIKEAKVPSQVYFKSINIFTESSLMKFNGTLIELKLGCYRISQPCRTVKLKLVI